MQALDTTLSIPLVDLKTQYDSIKWEIDAALASVIDETAFIGGTFVKAFEMDFARYCGVTHCVGVGNGTDALCLSLMALGVGPGDEVITVANSFVATSEAIRMAGARVVFVDCDPETYNIDVTRIEEKITPNTKAIIPVHLYGRPADMDPILSLAKKHGLRIVADAAQAHGALYKGQPIASLADITCFSFYPGKNLGAYGDAGAIVTNDDQLALKARMLANHGRVDKYDHEIEGVNSRLDGVQAAVLSVKLRHLSQWTEQRRANAGLYAQWLKATDLVTPAEPPDIYSVYHLYVVRVPDGRRQRLQAHLNSKGISTGIHYPIALPSLKAYSHLNHTDSDFIHANQASREILSLPMFPELSTDQIASVCDTAREVL
jgi:dTDP-4-amino-4,6-dideoxygalactose transaminase